MRSLHAAKTAVFRFVFWALMVLVLAAAAVPALALSLIYITIAILKGNAPKVTVKFH
ncbi:hypothetical protein LAV_00046 [Sphingobium phage Lacusarx]|uniref:Uncharacterized protein n=1 Tax=Sphingobium phage Lacusarx TaxID=1980139 RepID=A0A1W6DX61_9CAUD|nr:hypothetical protein FDH44_gp046 [Sphingobium phage Lacusarx]ARK07446.1 hypothetical protein LAV_00046 [Sphingobium phage Lacusarx]